MTTEERNLITRCAELTAAVEAEHPEEWQTWIYFDWLDQMQHGPCYAVSTWFGPVPEWQRMRYRRAIEALEEAGLVATWRRGGIRLTHVRLTGAGLARAKQLQPPAELATTEKENR